MTDLGGSFFLGMQYALSIIVEQSLTVWSTSMGEAM